MLYIILIEPENPGNIGAIARIIANFGYMRLILINPKTKITEETRRRAKHAQKILDNAVITDQGFLKKMDLLIATTAKTGTDYNIPRSPIKPDDLAKKIPRTGKIGLVIGREGIGLTNEELKICNIVVTIPSNKKYPTLNISHAVAIILYELAKNKKNSSLSHIERATGKDIEILEKYLNSVIDKMKFTTEDKRQTQRIVWKRTIGKAMLTKREVFALIGFFKKLM